MYKEIYSLMKEKGYKVPLTLKIKGILNNWGALTILAKIKHIFIK
jgi:hypothetical protein